jgi:hypothetical protein
VTLRISNGERATTIQKQKNTDRTQSSSTTTQQSFTTSYSTAPNSTLGRKGSPSKEQKLVYDNKPLTPIDAKQIQHNLLKKHKLQIHGKNN